MSDVSNYHRKKDELIVAYEATESIALRQMLHDAIFHTDVCMYLFNDFIRAARISTDQVIAIKEEFTREQEELDHSIQQLNTLIDTPDDNNMEILVKNKELYDIIEKMKIHREKTIQVIEETKQIMSESSHSIVTIQGLFLLGRMEEISDSLFNGIYKGRESKYLIDAMIIFLHYLIGLSPLGIITSTIQSVKDVYQVQLRDIRAASDYMRYIETYTITAKTWALTSQITIDAISGLHQNKTTAKEESSKTLNEKIELIKSNWHYKKSTF